MPRTRIKTVTWESIVDELAAERRRHIIRRKPKQSPYVYIEDKTKRKLTSLSPLCWEVIEDVKQAAKICRFVGDRNFPNSIPIPVLIHKSNSEENLDSSDVIYDWDQVMQIVEEHLVKTMKASSAKNVRADIRNLRNAKTPFIWKKVKAWVFQKELDSRPFKNRLDSLEQLRLALSSKYGDEPEWLMRKDLVLLRQQNNASRSKSVRYQPGKDISGVRAIPTKKEAEDYLDSIGEEFPLEQWALAMQMCYGLRNHELWHCAPITKEDKSKGMAAGWLYIPGNWRTKSKFEHWTFPLYPSWINRYSLAKMFKVMQDSLNLKAKPRIVSAIDMSKRWSPDYDNDMGVCTNNDYLGSWITKRMREKLPEWKASVPNAKGHHAESSKKVAITPYDLRHTWAVSIATLPEWNHVDEIQAAQAMGHDVATHRKHYWKWISIDEARKGLMQKVQFKIA